jgi:hypothetical protein
MNWKPVLTDLFSEFPATAGLAVPGAARFSRLSAVPAITGVACLEAVELRRSP